MAGIGLELARRQEKRGGEEREGVQSDNSGSQLICTGRGQFVTLFVSARISGVFTVSTTWAPPTLIQVSCISMYQCVQYMYQREELVIHADTH